MYWAFISPPLRAQEKSRPDPSLPGSAGPARDARLLHVMDALDDARELRPVLVPHRLDRRLEGLLVADLDDLDAGLLHLLDRLLLHLVPEGALLLLRLLGELHDQVLLLLRQRGEDALREHQDLGDH